MSFPIYTVNTFTVGGDAFTGNPAGVCLLRCDDDISDIQKQKIAKELNLPVTAFVSLGWTEGEKMPELHRTIRWFTPTQEVPLCGHATTALGRILLETQFKDVSQLPKTITIHAKSKAKLEAILETDGSISLNFPSNPPQRMEDKDNPWVEDILEKTGISKGTVQDLLYSVETKTLLVRLKDDLPLKELLETKPDFAALLLVDTKGCLLDHVLVMAKGQGDYHFYSRFFAPWIGINEDQATGSAHTVLTPYWSKELGKKGEVLRARQFSPRGGELICELLGDRVKINGQPKIIMEGKLFL